MTVSITGSSLSASSNTLTFEEGSASIVAKTGQKFLTYKFVTCSTYVFKRGPKIPVAYLLPYNSHGGSCTVTFDITKGAGTVTGGSCLIVLPDYYTQISSVLTDSDITPTYYVSACVSQLAPTSSAGKTEREYFRTNLSFDKSAYSTSALPPVIRASDEIIPNPNNNYITSSINGTVITFVIDITQVRYTYISLMASL